MLLWCCYCYNSQTLRVKDTLFSILRKGKMKTKKHFFAPDQKRIRRSIEKNNLNRNTKAAAQRCSAKKSVLKNFGKFAEKTLSSLKLPEDCNSIKKETPAQIFSYQFCEVFKSTYFAEYLQIAASQNGYAITSPSFSLPQFCKKIQMGSFPSNFFLKLRQLKIAKYGVFSVPYFPVFGLNTDQKELRIWTLFTQC